MININFNKLKGNKIILLNIYIIIKLFHNNIISLFISLVFIKSFHHLKDLKNTIKIISIPIYVGLNQSKQDKVIKIIKSYFQLGLLYIIYVLPLILCNFYILN